MIGGRVVEQFIDEALAAAAAMDEQIFECHEAIEVDAQLRLAPLSNLARVTAREVVLAAIE